MVLDIIKDFALVDRREYVPYCPLCTTSFTASGDICVLTCNHFLCRDCFGRLTSQVCPFCQSDAQMRTGDFLGDAVTFLSTWFEEVARGRSRDEVVDQLIEQILVVRKNLKCKDLPCRIQAEGRICSEAFRCPYDHKLTNFQKQICTIPQCPYGDRCFFIHPPPPKPISNPPSVPADQSAAPLDQSAAPSHQSAAPSNQSAAPSVVLPSSKPSAKSSPARQSGEAALPGTKKASAGQSSKPQSAGSGQPAKKGETNSSSKKVGTGQNACCRLM
jgi:hypothetical protein